MTILTGGGVSDIQVGANGIKVKLKDKAGKESAAEFSHMIVAIGIVPNTENIRLKELGVAMDERGFLKTADMCRTNVEGLGAPGDTTEPPCQAHNATH